MNSFPNPISRLKQTINNQLQLQCFLYFCAVPGGLGHLGLLISSVQLSLVVKTANYEICPVGMIIYLIN